MDCCICSTLAFRPPRNTICASCFEGARSILSLSSRIERQWKLSNESENKSTSKGLDDAVKRLEHLELMEDEASSRLEFLESLIEAFREGSHTDVDLVTNDGHSLRAHRIVLATKSSVFKTMFEVDPCKSEHTGAVFINELNRRQLESLLEFLYCARLSDSAISEHSAALLVAADKYDIPVLAKLCEAHLAKSVTRGNVFEMLELAALCSAAALRESAMKVVLDDSQNIFFSKEYEDFAIRNAAVTVELIRAFIRGGRHEATL